LDFRDHIYRGVSAHLGSRAAFGKEPAAGLDRSSFLPGWAAGSLVRVLHFEKHHQVRTIDI
jgi:hypothetical protein